MSEINDILNSWLSDVQKDIAANYNRLGLKASGDFEKSLEPFNEVKKGLIRAGILGNNYAYWLENGRKPTKSTTAGSPTLREIIGKWIEVKGIKPKDGISKESLTFLIARKIHNEGIKVPNKYNKGGLISDIVTKEKIQELNKSLSLYFVSKVKSKIIKDLK